MESNPLESLPESDELELSPPGYSSGGYPIPAGMKLVNDNQSGENGAGRPRWSPGNWIALIGLIFTIMVFAGGALVGYIQLKDQVTILSDKVTTMQPSQQRVVVEIDLEDHTGTKAKAHVKHITDGYDPAHSGRVSPIIPQSLSTDGIPLPPTPTKN